jgi:hypothetical protein
LLQKRYVIIDENDVDRLKEMLKGFKMVRDEPIDEIKD